MRASSCPSKRVKTSARKLSLRARSRWLISSLRSSSAPTNAMSAHPSERLASARAVSSCCGPRMEVTRAVISALESFLRSFRSMSDAVNPASMSCCRKLSSAPGRVDNMRRTPSDSFWKTAASTSRLRSIRWASSWMMVVRAMSFRMGRSASGLALGLMNRTHRSGSDFSTSRATSRRRRLLPIPPAAERISAFFPAPPWANFTRFRRSWVLPANAA